MCFVFYLCFPVTIFSAQHYETCKYYLLNMKYLCVAIPARNAATDHFSPGVSHVKATTQI